MREADLNGGVATTVCLMRRAGRAAMGVRR